MANRVLIFVLFLMPISVPSISAQTTSVALTRTGSSIIVDVTIGGKTRHFLLDTGAGLTVLSPDIAGWSPVDVMKAVSRRSAVGLDGSAHSMGSTTTTLELGKILTKSFFMKRKAGRGVLPIAVYGRSLGQAKE
jgi:predicted aspartyl protease